MKHLLLIILLTITTTMAFSQNLTQVQVEQIGKKVHVTYTLDKTADITLHLSLDGGVTYSEPLKNVTGDVGKNITPGTHTIVWDVLAERENLKGENIVFMVQAGINYDQIVKNAKSKNIGYSNSLILEDKIIKKKIIDVLELYYNLKPKNINELNLIFTNPIEKYFSKTNYSLDVLILENEKYLKKFSYKSIFLDTNSLNITNKLEEGFFDVNFNIIVVVKNISTGKIYKFYETIFVKFNSKFKIFYLTEQINAKEILN